MLINERDDMYCMKTKTPPSKNAAALRPFLTKTPTQIPLTVPNPKSLKFKILSASLYSPVTLDAALSIGEEDDP